jgi:hypothetical protein
MSSALRVVASSPLDPIEDVKKLLTEIDKCGKIGR